MEAINPESNPNKKANWSSGSAALSKQSIQSNKAPASQKLLHTELTDIPSMSSKAKHSSPELRQDIIDRAKSLINDPNWLNDQNLDLLAGKISEEEKF